MIAFARARTRSLLSMLWPLTVKAINTDKVSLDKYTGLIKKHEKEKNRFLEVTKNGGIWFS
tara:strand:- start:1606 stop:1788 length:183 start_codon:yes stop_codon:yes gene_type:complete